MFEQIKEIHGKDRVVHGGAERYLQVLNDVLIEDGHAPVTIYCGYSPPGPGRYPREIHKRHGNMNLICFCMTTDWEYNTNSELNRWYNENTQFDDLHIYFATYFGYPYMFPQNSIAVCHGVWWEYAYGPLRTWKEDDAKEFWRRTLYGFTAPRVVVSVDANTKNVISAISPGSQSRILVIPNFVDTEVFKPAPKRWKGIRVLLPRRMTLIRGANLFNNAAQDLPHYQFIACGQAINENEEKEYTKVFHKQIPNFLQMWLPAEEMPDLYQRADIAVIPTVCSEGTSISAAEAMSSGLGVIASNVGGLNQMVIDNHNGLVFDPDYDSLSEKIQTLAEDPVLRKRLGREARQTAIDAFDIQRWKAQWRQLIPPVRTLVTKEIEI